jgi:hypothetical protein
MTPKNPTTQVEQENLSVLPSWLRISLFHPLVLLTMVLPPLVPISLAIVTKYPGAICFTAPSGWQIKIAGSEIANCPLPTIKK